jgi:SAM-dependent methyltransferase
MSEFEDQRREIYRDLHQGQISQQEEANRGSAELVLSQLFRYYTPTSVVDVGCGIGTWLAVARRMGVADMRGIEGNWLDRSLVRVPENLIAEVDLERPFDLGRRFDLVISLEVAEHLSPGAASGFVESLVRHADVVLFSAAIPFQGGHHHVNEQFLSYWCGLFERCGYRPVDFLRSLFWDNPSVHWWLRQNMVVFATQELTAAPGPFAGLTERNGPLSIVHPDIYFDRVKSALAAAKEHDKLISLLASGNTFSVVRQPNGQLTINRLS